MVEAFPSTPLFVIPCLVDAYSVGCLQPLEEEEGPSALLFIIKSYPELDSSSLELIGAALMSGVRRRFRLTTGWGFL